LRCKSRASISWGSSTVLHDMHVFGSVPGMDGTNILLNLWLFVLNCKYFNLRNNCLVSSAFKIFLIERLFLMIGSSSSSLITWSFWFGFMPIKKCLKI
jgi:hypothetical protein